MADGAMKEALRITVVTSHLPHVATSGGRRRELELMERIADQHHVEMICVTKTFDEDRELAKRLRSRCHGIRLVPTDIQAPEAPPIGGDTRPWHVARHASASAPAEIARGLRRHRPDVVHVEGYYLMQHLPGGWPGPILLGTQNVEHALLRQRAELTIDRSRRKLLLEQVLRTRSLEREAWRRAESVVAVSPEDRLRMLTDEANLDVHVVGNGADHEPTLPRGVGTEAAPVSTTGPPLIAYVANFDYWPSRDGAEWFLDEILPRLRSGTTDFDVAFVGNMSSRTLADRAGAAGVRVVGLVPSLDALYRSAHVVVCPIRVGGGVKVKVLEALRAGAAIITTSVGAEGLASAQREVLNIADDPADFADAVEALVSVPRQQRGSGGPLPTWGAAAQELERCYRVMIDRAGASRPSTSRS
ncbi:glycosyltransferase [Nocardia xishanensis]|uniref:glycosyltransferase n=1 Tax=Nocardia xishanensis TaxID=238964 RepID=UPI00342D637F